MAATRPPIGTKAGALSAIEVFPLLCVLCVALMLSQKCACQLATHSVPKGTDHGARSTCKSDLPPINAPHHPYSTLPAPRVCCAGYVSWGFRNPSTVKEKLLKATAQNTVFALGEIPVSCGPHPTQSHAPVSTGTQVNIANNATIVAVRSFARGAHGKLPAPATGP